MNELARKIQMDQGLLSKIERGKRPPPQLVPRVQRIGAALGMGEESLEFKELVEAATRNASPRKSGRQFSIWKLVREERLNSCEFRYLALGLEPMHPQKPARSYAQTHQPARPRPSFGWYTPPTCFELTGAEARRARADVSVQSTRHGCRTEWGKLPVSHTRPSHRPKIRGAG